MIVAGERQSYDVGREQSKRNNTGRAFATLQKPASQPGASYTVPKSLKVSQKKASPWCCFADWQLSHVLLISANGPLQATYVCNLSDCQKKKTLVQQNAPVVDLSDENNSQPKCN